MVYGILSNRRMAGGPRNLYRKYWKEAEKGIILQLPGHFPHFGPRELEARGEVVIFGFE
jgi:hypothetical protein